MSSIEEFIKTIAKLRAPDGCPWDREQTHKTLKRYLIEEAYETIEAIDNEDPKELMEELGDVLLQVVLHAQLAAESKEFSFDEIVTSINKKMISRHPHVFSNTVVKNTEEVLVNWEKLKEEEKPNQENIFNNIPKALPALMKALEVSKKAAKTGFEWENQTKLWETFESELKEFKEATTLESIEKQKEELGDLLFMMVNLARWYKLDPEECLNSGIKKFVKRFTKVIKKAKNKGIKELSLIELNKLWEEVKKEEI